MKQITRAGALAGATALLAATPQLAFAESAASGADILLPKPAEFVPALIVFIIIWAVIAKVAWPKISATMDERGKKIAESLNEAEEAKKKAQATQAESDALVTDARRQASEIVLAARGEADKERARILAEAHDEAEDIISKARERAREEEQRIYADATDSIAKVSVAVAGKIVGDALVNDEAKQRELVKKYVAEVGSLHE